MLAFLSMLTGCYQYVPATEVTPGAQVRARLTEAGRGIVTQQLGPGVEELVGTYLGPDDDALSLLVSEYVSERGGRQSMWNEALRLPRGGIAQLERREFSRTKSVLFGIGVIAALSATYVALDISGQVFDSDGDTEPGPTDFRLVIRVPPGWGIR